MSVMMMRKIGTAVAAVAMLASACGGADHDAHTGSVEEGTVPGSAAPASEADRTVEVLASDHLRFDPAVVEVEAGEAITFVVTNEGKIVHEFVLGDAAYQEEHGSGMDHGEGGMDNAVTLAPGETAELTWRFDESGEVLYGCHEPGHYDGGMVGEVEVG